MKKFENPMLQIVSINKHDIIATSKDAPYDPNSTQNNGDALAPGQRGLFDPYDAGY